RSTSRRERPSTRSAARRTWQSRCRRSLPLAKSDIDVAVDLFQSPPQLLDPVCRALNPAGQIAHLSLEPVHAKFGVDRRIMTRGKRGDAATAVDLPLQHAEISFQSLETVLHRPILRSGRVDW